MKKLFLWMLAYYWLVGVGVQLLSYVITGKFVHGYGEGIYTCPDKYYWQAAGLLTIVIFLSMFFIWINPKGQQRLKPIIEIDSIWYFYLVITFLIVSRILIIGWADSNAFNAVVSGVYNGTLYEYFKLFIDAQTIFLITLLCARNKVSLWLSSGLYIFYTMLTHSRAGVLFVFVIFIAIIASSEKVKEYGRKIKRGVILAIIMGPISYIIVTKSRGSDYGGSIIGIIEKIVNRCSRLELAGIPLHQLDLNTYDKEIFESKFSLYRQLQLCINSLLPGDIFEGDVQPNQYYRSIFLGRSESFSFNYYESNNMTFPSYLTLKYGFVVAIVIAVLVIVGLYFLSIKLEKYAISRIIPVLLLTDVLDFFDWVYIFQHLFIITCTIFLFWFYRKISRRIRIGNVKTVRIKGIV